MPLSGAQTININMSKKPHLTVHFPPFMIVVIIVLQVIQYGIPHFMGTTALSWKITFPMWAFFGLFMWGSLRTPGENSFRVFMWCLIAAAYSAFAPEVIYNHLIPAIPSSAVAAEVLKFVMGFLVAVPGFFLFIFFSSNREDLHGFVVKYFMALLLLFIVALTVKLGSDNIELSGYDPGVGVEAFLKFLIESTRIIINGIGERTTKFTTQIVNRTVGAEFFSVVESNQGEEQRLGVYIESIRASTSGMYLPNEPMAFFADLVGKSFVGEPMVKNYCYLRLGRSLLTEEADLIPGTMTPAYPVPLTDDTFQGLMCQFPSFESMQAENPELKVGNVYVVFMSNFNFTTYGYVTYTFMNQKELSTYANKQKLANDLGVLYRPQAVYTNGPVTLGLVNPSSSLTQPIGLSFLESEGEKKVHIPISFGVTIGNKYGYSRQGRIMSVKSLEFYVPDPFEIDSCAPIDVLNVNPYVQGLPAGFKNYSFDASKIDFSRPDINDVTIQCTLVGPPASILGEGGISINTFAVKSDYEYSLTRDMPVMIRRPS